jgi:hypothetical protein
VRAAGVNMDLHTFRTMMVTNIDRSFLSTRAGAAPTSLSTAASAPAPPGEPRA